MCSVTAFAPSIEQITSHIWFVAMMAILLFGLTDNKLISGQVGIVLNVFTC
jgi:hypothetical protein